MNVESLPRWLEFIDKLRAHEEFWNLTKELLDQLLSSETTTRMTPEQGGEWISNLGGHWGSHDGSVVSCYYHPTKKHTVTTVGKMGMKRNYAEAGEWAVSVQTKARWGNKTYYNVLD